MIDIKIPDLRPCPFCGNRNVKMNDSLSGRWVVMCYSIKGSCGAMGPVVATNTYIKDFDDKTIAELAAKIEAANLWNECPRKYKTVRDLSSDELYELKQRHYIKDHQDQDIIGDLDDLYPDEFMFEAYADDNFVDDDFFCNGGNNDE